MRGSDSAHQQGTYTTEHVKEEERKEEHLLFNDALNTFFIYGYMASECRKETRGAICSAVVESPFMVR